MDPSIDLDEVNLHPVAITIWTDDTGRFDHKALLQVIRSGGVKKYSIVV